MALRTKIPNRFAPVSKSSKTLKRFQEVSDNSSLIFLEKAKKSTGGKVELRDIAEALKEFSTLFKAGIASKGEILTLARAFPDAPEYTEAAFDIPDETVMVVGGPASVSLIDREGHMITTDALGKAFKKYMDNFRTRNAMVLHSDVQVGWALPAYITKGGQIYKSGIEGDSLFFICEVRDDTKVAEKVREQIKEGKLKSYSIAGSATKVQNMQKGLMPYMQVDEMELAEVTVCEKGVNQGASFELLKAEKQPELILMSKDDVHYRDAGEAQDALNINCGSCVHFNEEDESCAKVEGIIKADDYCDIYEPKEDSPDTMATEPEEIMGDKNPDIEIRIQLMKKGNGDIDFIKSFLNLMKGEKEFKDTNLENFMRYMEPEWDSSKVQKQSGIEDGHPTFDWAEYGLRRG